MLYSKPHMFNHIHPVPATWKFALCIWKRRGDSWGRTGVGGQAVYGLLVLPASFLLACLVSTSFLFGGGWVAASVVLARHSVSAWSGSVTMSSADSLANSSSE